MQDLGADHAVNIQQPDVLGNRRGRKLDSVTVYSKSAVARLAESGFDPIKKLVQLYEEINKEIADLENLKLRPVMLSNGDTRRYSSIAHAQLLTTQQKLINDLVRYGYARIPETVNVKPEAPPPLVINLTPDNGNFNPDAIVDFRELSDDGLSDEEHE